MPRRQARVTQSDIAPEAPLRLGIAATIAYPDGSMTASGFVSKRCAADLQLSVLHAKTIQP
jgi:hypothetical protein